MSETRKFIEMADKERFINCSVCDKKLYLTGYGEKYDEHGNRTARWPVWEKCTKELHESKKAEAKAKAKANPEPEPEPEPEIESKEPAEEPEQPSYGVETTDGPFPLECGFCGQEYDLNEDQVCPYCQESEKMLEEDDSEPIERPAIEPEQERDVEDEQAPEEGKALVYQKLAGEITEFFVRDCIKKFEKKVDGYPIKGRVHPSDLEKVQKYNFGFPFEADKNLTEGFRYLALVQEA